MKIILAILIVIIVFALAVYAYYGGFTSVKFEIKEQGGEVLVYEDVVGDYGQAGEVTNRVYQTLLDKENIATTKGFGIFLDNPKSVEKSKLRSEIGCIIDDADVALIARLSEKYNVKVFPRNKYASAEFPMKGKLSIFVGIMKVYPVLNKFCEEHNISGGAVMEIYDVPNKKTIYRDTKAIQ